MTGRPTERALLPDRWSRAETEARDHAFLEADGMSARDGRLWNEAWAAARAYYAPNADEANALTERLGLTREALNGGEHA